MPFIGAAGELEDEADAAQRPRPARHRHPAGHPARRTDRFLDQDIKRKIVLFCDVDEAVITAKDVTSIYEVPLVLAAEGLDRIVLQRLSLPQTEARMNAWSDLVDRIKNPSDDITIHVGRQIRRLRRFAQEPQRSALPRRLQAPSAREHWWVEALEQPGGEQLLDGANGILVPGGFGDRGTRG